MSREVVEFRGGTGHLAADMRFLVYPNSEAQVPNNIPPGLAEIGEQAIDYGAANSYAVLQDYRYPNLTADSKANLLDKWIAEEKPDERGYHLLLTGNVSFTAGVSQSPWGPGAWTDQLHGVSTNGANNPKVTAMHEALHSFVNQNADGVKELHKEFSGDHVDHDLGQIFANSQSSPLIMGYDLSHGGHGDCSSGALPLGVTTQLSECSKTGLKKTAEDAGVV